MFPEYPENTTWMLRVIYTLKEKYLVRGHGVRLESSMALTLCPRAKYFHVLSDLT